MGKLKYLIIFVVILLIIAISSFLVLSLNKQLLSEKEVIKESFNFPTEVPQVTPTIKPKLPTPTVSSTILIENVPFASQAPFGTWSDPRQQDGCEEASSLIAISWAKNQTFTKDKALQEILAIADYQLAKYGSYKDTNPQDTVERIIKGYFNYQKAEVKKVTSIQNLIEILRQGYLIITPMNGQALNNPNFTAPGPERHMLVVRGYDPKNREFITNDPGTRKGEMYRYPEQTFFNAIRVYPTGDHLPITPQEKEIIIIKK